MKFVISMRYEVEAANADQAWLELRMTYHYPSGATIEGEDGTRYSVTGDGVEQTGGPS